MKPSEALTKTQAVIRRKHYSLATEQTYLAWLRRYMAFLAQDKFPGTSESKMEKFLSVLAADGVAASTQNQAFNAILFFYRDVLGQKLGDIKALRAQRPAHIRHAPGKADVVKLLQNVQDQAGYPTRLIVHLLYGCGLRVSEPLNLRLKDVDLAGSRLFIRGAKGGKDRVISIPCSLLPAIQRHKELAEKLWQTDQAAGIPVPLPGLLDRKYPRHKYSRAWYWLFPARTTCQHPRTGETVRWRCHEANVQRAVKSACTRALIDTITPHHLRHAFATHCLDAGQNIRHVQEALGHASLETTMGYVHADSTSVRSPLEGLVDARF